MMVFVLRLDRLREGRKIPKVGDALARVSDGHLGKEMFYPSSWRENGRLHMVPLKRFAFKKGSGGLPWWLTPVVPGRGLDG